MTDNASNKTDNGLSGRLLKKFIGFSLSTWIGAVLSFAITPITTRVFETTELGKINLFQTYVTLFMYLALLGLQQGYIRFHSELPEGFTKKTLYKYCLSVSAVFTLILDVVLLVFWRKISIAITGTENIYIAICLSVCVLDYIIMTMSSSEYRMEQNAIGYNIQQIGIIVSTKIAFLFAIIISPTHVYGIIFMTSLFTLWTIVTLFMHKNNLTGRINNIPFASRKSILVYSLPWVPILFVNYLNTSLPKIVLKQMIDVSTVGIYASAVSIVSVITLVQAGFNIFWTPYVYENYRNNSHRIKAVHNLIVPLMISFAIAVLLFQDVLYLILGEAYRASKDYFGMLLMSPVLYTIAETTGLGINISKKTKFNLLAIITTIIINLILCYI
ncbi:MAG: lipopolysaccharide biosynthesis protein, partial [Eubacteriales bacterium]|nr:lipopolysaccharide biosynthesis protein [Eubacteriales bacterium]